MPDAPEGGVNPSEEIVMGVAIPTTEGAYGTENETAGTVSREATADNLWVGVGLLPRPPNR